MPSSSMAHPAAASRHAGIEDGVAKTVSVGMGGTLAVARGRAHRGGGRAAIAAADGLVAAGSGCSYLGTMDDATTKSRPVEPTENPAPERPKEIGGPKGPEPTRYGDW